MKFGFTIDDCEAVPETADPRVLPRDVVVTRYVIERWHRDIPDKTYVIFDDNDEEWTYGAFRNMVVQTAAGLQSLGVQQGDHLFVWLPNCRENLRIFFAVNYLGAVYVGINTAYRGGLLTHVIENSDAKVAIVHSDLVERLDDIPLSTLTALVVVGKKVEFSRLPVYPYEKVLLPEEGRIRPLMRPIEPWDTQTIIYTSGTTGPSKGVCSSYLHMYSNNGPETWACITSEDRFIINMPMFHIGGCGASYTMFARGASIVYMERFNTSTFWETVRRCKGTSVVLLGVMAGFLEKQPLDKDDADNPLRMLFMIPLNSDIDAFSKRFGVDVYTFFNMTEVSTPTISGPNPKVRGTCGRPRPGVEVRLVDGNDCEVPIGEVGEMLVRTDRPWAMCSGYYKNPEATAEALRNGWFHTGDAFRTDEDGNFYFVDRIKDTIRRRGENISSFEVEAEALAFPDLMEAAAVGVPNEICEEDVMLAVAPKPDRDIDPAQLIHFLKDRLAHFMVPRYIRILPELPKTPNAKIQKHLLKKEGITPDAWDREKTGIKIKSHRFGRSESGERNRLGTV